MALVASLMVADKISGGTAYVTQTLSGCMLWVNWPLVWVTILVYGILGWLHFKFRHPIIAITEKGHSGNDKKWDLLFFLSLGIITVLIVPIAGVLLAYAFLMIPAATAALFTNSWTKALVIGWAAGFLSSLLGLFSSYHFHLPYGPTLVLSLGLCFLIALVFRFLKPGKEASEPEPLQECLSE